MKRRRPLRLTCPTRVTLTDSMAADSPPFTKTGLEHCGWVRLTDCTGLTGRMERSPGTRKARDCQAVLFAAFRKIERGGFGSALRRAYPGSTLSWRLLETTTCP